MNILHNFSEQFIDEMIQSLKSDAKRYNKARRSIILETDNVKVVCFFSFDALSDLASIDLYPNDNSHISYESSIECPIRFFKKKILSKPYLKIKIPNTQKRNISSTDKWTQKQSDDAINSYNEKCTKEFMQITDKEKEMIENARKKT